MMTLVMPPKGKKKPKAYFTVLIYIAMYAKLNLAAIRSPCLATA